MLVFAPLMGGTITLNELTSSALPTVVTSAGSGSDASPPTVAVSMAVLICGTHDLISANTGMRALSHTPSLIET